MPRGFPLGDDLERNAGVAFVHRSSVALEQYVCVHAELPTLLKGHVVPSGRWIFIHLEHVRR